MGKQNTPETSPETNDKGAIERMYCGIRTGANALDVSPSTVRRKFIDTGKVRVYKLGNRSLLKWPELKQAVEELLENA